MILRRSAVVALLVLTLLPALNAQTRLRNLRFRHISIPQGLSQSTINTILQDRAGFMWFGTQDGLNRFDAYEFTVFRHVPTDTTSISDNYIWTMVEDRAGNLWVGTLNNGLNRCGADRSRFVRFQHREGDPTSLANNDVTALCLDRNGDLLVGTWGGGLQRYDSRANSFRRIPVEDNRVQCLLADSAGLLWVGTWAGLELFDSTGSSIARYVHDDRIQGSLSGNRITTLRKDRKGALWVGTYDAGLDRFNPNDRTFSSFRHDPENGRTLSSDAVRSLAEDIYGRLWVGTADEGINVMIPGEKGFVQIRNDPSNPSGVSSDRVFSMLRDDTGGLWVGTADAGVNRYDPWSQNFMSIRHIPADPAGLSNNSVRSMLVDRNGDLWVGTFGGGLNRKRPGTTEFVHYRHRTGDEAGLASDAILALHESEDGVLWIGTADRGLDRLDILRGTFRHFRHKTDDPGSLAGNAVMAIAAGKHGDLWIGMTAGGIDKWDKRTGKFEHIRPNAGTTAGLGGSSVWSIHQGTGNTLWLGTWGTGLIRLELPAGSMRRYLHDPNDPHTISNNTVWSIYESPDSVLWLGTWGGGLDRFDLRSETFQSFTEADGLPNNVVYGILPDDDGNLWLSTNKGLAQFDPRTGMIRCFDALDGLQGDEFSQGAYCRGRDGRLFFGGVNGYSAFSPDSITLNPYPPPVVLTSFQVFNRPVPFSAQLSSGSAIDVSFRDNFLSFEFSALSYTIPEKNLYAYKLEGFDKEWVYCGTRRYVSYSQLDGGDYLFRVKGSNNDGVWNVEGVALRLHVEPPFYRTTWFIVLVIAALGTTAYGIYRFRVNKLLEVERLRTRIASDLHDDIGSGLTRIAVLSDVVAQQIATEPGKEPRLRGAGGEQEANEAASSTIRKVGNIARELVDAMSDVVWSIDPRHDSSTSLIQRVRTYAFEMCEAKGIALDFQTTGSPDVLKLSPETVRGFLLFSKEAITNIVRHSGCAHAGIKILFDRKQVSINVWDDGTGFDPETRKEGNGLTNMRVRAEKGGGEFVLETAPGKGTALTVSLPWQ